MSDFSALVLAAGHSRRMGTPKAYLHLAGQTLAERLCATCAQGGAHTIVVVAGASDAADPTLASVALLAPLVQARLDPAAARLRFTVGCPEGTPLDSLRCGLRLVPQGQNVLLWPIDYPFADSALVRALVLALGERRDQVAIPLAAGRRGHPVLLGAEVALELWSDTLVAGARDVVLRSAERQLLVPVADARVAEDCDTPEQARALGIEGSNARAPLT